MPLPTGPAPTPAWGTSRSHITRVRSKLREASPLTCSRLTPPCCCTSTTFANKTTKTVWKNAKTLVTLWISKWRRLQTNSLRRNTRTCRLMGRSMHSRRCVILCLPIGTFLSLWARRNMKYLKIGRRTLMKTNYLRSNQSKEPNQWKSHPPVT